MSVVLFEFIVTSLTLPQACKIVTLAVARGPDLALPGSITAGYTGNDGSNSLRQAALWFPGFPPLSLDLNLHSFPQGLSYTNGFRPLIWTHFGGPKGIYLRNLVAIRFHVNHELYGIDFRYNDDYVPESCRSIGRHKCPGRSCYGNYEFDIDGPGGELVASIEISLFTFHGNEASIGHQTGVVDVKVRFQLQTNLVCSRIIS